MAARHLLAVLIVAATAAFVTGVSIERANGDTHQEEVVTDTEAGGPEEGESGEGEEGKSEEGEESAEAGAAEEEDERVLGVDLEATPFIVLAAIASLALAAAAWLRPHNRRLLLAAAAAMLAFAVLDIAEVLRKADESDTGLVVLASVVALLHLAATAVAAGMSREALGLGEA